MEIQEISSLSQNESRIYLAILDIKTATVKDIAKKIGLHRTYIYDILEKLKERGLVTFYREGKVQHFKCSDPDNLYNYLDQTRTELDHIVPELKKRYRQSLTPIEIDVFKGKSGLISAYKDILKERKPVKGLGISRKMNEYLPIFREQFFRQIKAKHLKFELIYTRKLAPLSAPFVSKYLEQEFDSPIEVLLYGEKTLQIIWEPEMRAILIRSKNFTETYEKHFNVLWKQAKNM